MHTPTLSTCGSAARTLPSCFWLMPARAASSMYTHASCSRQHRQAWSSEGCPQGLHTVQALWGVWGPSSGLSTLTRVHALALLSGLVRSRTRPDLAAAHAAAGALVAAQEVRQIRTVGRRRQRLHVTPVSQGARRPLWRPLHAAQRLLTAISCSGFHAPSSMQCAALLAPATHPRSMHCHVHTQECGVPSTPHGWAVPSQMHGTLLHASEDFTQHPCSAAHTIRTPSTGRPHRPSADTAPPRCPGWPRTSQE